VYDISGIALLWILVLFDGRLHILGPMLGTTMNLFNSQLMRL
jgi:hypothetical protein